MAIQTLTLQQKRATATRWTSVNPVLLAGEIGVELNDVTNIPQKIKIGDGVTAWSSLSYFAGGGGSGSSTTFSTTAPTSPSNGDVWVDSSTGTELVYINDGNSTQWVELNTNGGTTNAMSIIYLPSSAITVTGTGATGSVDTAGTITVSSASTIKIQNCFLSSYTNYKMIINLNSPGTPITFQMVQSNGTVDSTANYDRTYIWSTAGGTPNANGSAAGTSWTSLGTSSMIRHRHIFEIFNPFLTVPTTVTGVLNLNTTTGVEIGNLGLQHRASTSFTGFYIVGDAASFTGTIKIYGYN